MICSQEEYENARIVLNNIPATLYPSLHEIADRIKLDIVEWEAKHPVAEGKED